MTTTQLAIVGYHDFVELTYRQRIDRLRETKMQQTREKQRVVGSMDHDDWALILPPPDVREIVQTMSTSGMPITDVLLKGYAPRSNHPSGGFFGPRAVGANFRRLLEAHPVYVDPISSLAGGYMVNFMSYRKVHWNPDFDYGHLHEAQRMYHLLPGIGAAQHFCQDLAIGLELGWGGLLAKVRAYRAIHAPRRAGFYDGLEDVVLGMQDWIGRTAATADAMARKECKPQLRDNLEAISDINRRLISEPPRTFREACQWILWYQIAARMYNGSGSLGRLDALLQPFYERDMRLGILTDEEAVFHIACLLLRDTAYLQLGGPDAAGRDVTSRVSFLILEAAHSLRIPSNIGVCVGASVPPELLRRGVEILFEDKAAHPKFLGIDRTTEGFMRNGYPAEVARLRAYSGCHWSAIPGREYTVNDCVKINFAQVFDVALREMLADSMEESGTCDVRARVPVQEVPSIDALWRSFEWHLGRAVDTIAAGLDFHLAHMHEVLPELVLDLLCHGPIERGEDASHGGVEFTNLCVDGSALATVADSFAAIEQRVAIERRLTWCDLLRHLDENWSGPDGERARLMMHNIARYGSGGSRGDAYAERISRTFTRLVTERPTPGGRRMIPGLFSWASTIVMGRAVGATPNGRRAGEPISHGANPDPGFRNDGAPTAMAVAIASVQPGYGNTAPMQIEFDPGITKEKGGVEHVAGLIRAHFDLGGTQINMNIMDVQRVLEAHKDPDKFPDLVVRVTGFSAYFASLSPEFRQLVVDRILAA
jgi:formate C-acetyltransferase